MFRKRWEIPLAIGLIITSIIVYFIHYYIFRDLHHILIYTIEDIAFVFVEVLLVTLIIHRLLTEREKRNMLKKLNMVIGSFYSEVGNHLLSSLTQFNPEANKISKQLVNIDKWSDKIFLLTSEQFRKSDYQLINDRENLKNLRDFLLNKRTFLLTLLENPNLLEHEKFTDLLWAVFHLTEELEFRTNLTNLPETDIQHIEGDIKRAYGLLIAQWITYMKHLKDDYPYLFSLSTRMNPFNPQASPIVKK